MVEKGRLTPTEEGTPQVGVISPLLLDAALHGMETAAGVRYQTTGVHAGEPVRDSPVLIRYADDLGAFGSAHCSTKARLSRPGSSVLAGVDTAHGIGSVRRVACGAAPGSASPPGGYSDVGTVRRRAHRAGPFSLGSPISWVARSRREVIMPSDVRQSGERLPVCSSTARIG